jgi:hypothetical protein
VARHHQGFERKLAPIRIDSGIFAVTDNIKRTWSGKYEVAEALDDPG